MPSWKKLITSGSSAKLSSLTVDNTVTADAFSGTFQGALSGSAQIKTEISGAFTSTSSSLATRVTSNESIVKGKTILSQSAQIKTQISGAFTATSSSIASDITEFKDGTVTLISGSATSTGSFGRVEVNASTIAIGGTEIDKTVADNITDLDQELNTTSSPTFAGLTSTDNITVAGLTSTDNITVQGDIIAENYIVSSSVTYMTQSFSSGSTIFGDSIGDTHQFTGSVLIGTGSISSVSNITASGDISASGTVTAKNVNIAGATADTLLDIDSTTVSHIVHVMGSGAIRLSGSLGVTGSLNVTGNISASVSSTGSFGALVLDGGYFTSASLAEAISASSAASSYGASGGSGGGVSSYTDLSNIPSDIVSSSTQIATQISGSLGSNASLIRTLTVSGISGSFAVASSSLAGRISTVEGTGTIQGVGQSDNVTFNKITTTGPDVFAGNVTIGGNLTLIGSQSSATKLTVTDQFGFFASGSEADNLDAGIMVQSGSSANTGSVLYHDVHPVANVNPQGGRWAVAKEFKVDSVTVTPLEYVVTVKSSGDTDDPDSTDVNYGVGEMYINNDGEIFIYTGN